MPKLKTHKGMKKRFKVSANGKVQHKRCGSSHLNSHKSGKQIRRLRKKSSLNVSAENAADPQRAADPAGDQPAGRRSREAGRPGRQGRASGTEHRRAATAVRTEPSRHSVRSA